MRLPMRCLPKDFGVNLFISVGVAFLLVGCSLIHPAPKTPPTEPVVEQVRKEEPPPPPRSEPPAPAPVKPPPLPPPPPPEKPKVAPTPALRVIKVEWSSVNLREGPGMNYKVVGNAKKGTSLGVLEEKGQWLRVRLEDGKEAWVYKASTASTSAAPKPSPADPRPKPKPM
jgi:hypothetical protein